MATASDSLRESGVKGPHRPNPAKFFSRCGGVKCFFSATAARHRPVTRDKDAYYLG